MGVLSIKHLMQRFKVRSKRMKSIKTASSSRGGGPSTTSPPSYEEPLANLLDSLKLHKCDPTKCSAEIESLKQVMSKYHPPSHHHKPTINFHLQEALKQRLKTS